MPAWSRVDRRLRELGLNPDGEEDNFAHWLWDVVTKWDDPELTDAVIDLINEVFSEMDPDERE